MLLATQFGLFGIIEPQPDVYHVCCGERSELENLLSITDVEAVVKSCEAPASGFRVEVELEDVLEMVVQLATRMHYADLGEHLVEVQKQNERLHAYGPLMEAVGMARPAKVGH